MKLISDSVTRSVGRKVIQLKRQSPHIFFAGGIVGVLGATFLACRATLKLEETLDIVKQDIDAVKEMGADSKAKGTPYADQEYFRDLGYVYSIGTFKMARLYGPAAVVGAVSISALTGAHVQLARRNTALTVTLAAVSKAYEEYRERVQEAIGDEREYDIYRNAKEVEIEVDGKKKTATVYDGNGFSPYARLFEESNLNWQNDGETNQLFIRCQLNYANHLLKARGHVFLNEVYDSLGLERSSAGQVVGWVMDGDGDNYIDFGIFDSSNSDFINGRERSVWLDFNVDGVVFEKI